MKRRTTRNQIRKQRIEASKSKPLIEGNSKYAQKVKRRRRHALSLGLSINAVYPAIWYQQRFNTI